MANVVFKGIIWLSVLCGYVFCTYPGAANNGIDEIVAHGRDLKTGDPKYQRRNKNAPKHQNMQRQKKAASRSPKDLDECTNLEWCSVEAPTKSLFRFATPIDPVRWKEAQIKAASGEQVLLAEIMKHFPTYLDFLDGDTKFRKIHHLADFYVDRNRDLSPLLATEPMKWKAKRAKEPYKWGNAKVLPRDHDFYPHKRAPIFKLGYYAFQSGNSLWFGGPEMGKALVSRADFSAHWQKVRGQVSRPHILLDVHDENWGLLSTHFPNRTAQWGDCCKPAEHAAMMDFLDHNTTLMALLNQHTNITHPKIVTLPRGLPIHKDHGARQIWDTLRYGLQMAVNVKNKFVFTASSDTLSRRDILTCIGKKFKPKDFTWEVGSSPEEAERRKKIGDFAYQQDYYNKLLATRVGIAPPGIGYDTFR